MRYPHGGAYALIFHPNEWKDAILRDTYNVTEEQIEAALKQPDGYIKSCGACELYVRLPIKV